jgi:eukaryotic-like serine/threonine-protein kinase
VAEWGVPGFTGLRTLGSGGSGEVVLARHDASGTPVAIKYLPPYLLADTEFARLFRAEAAVLATVDDPHVVRLYEYVESLACAAIVMEFVDGVGLREILEQQGTTTAEAALVVLQDSLLGLAAAHRRGVVHRDCKPENVLVTGEGDCKLTDFGIAPRSGHRPILAGALAYAPPEQFVGSPASPANPVSDVYAATAIFYECVAGRPPFTGDTTERLLHQHLTEPVPLHPVPEPLWPLVAAGMAKNPGDRPGDAAAFIVQLTTVAAGAYGRDWYERGRSDLGLLARHGPSSTPSARPGSAVERTHLSRRIPRRHVAIAIGAAAVIAAAGTALAAGGPRPRTAAHAVAAMQPLSLLPSSPSPASSAPKRSRKLSVQRPTYSSWPTERPAATPLTSKSAPSEQPASSRSSSPSPSVTLTPVPPPTHSSPPLPSSAASPQPSSAASPLPSSAASPLPSSPQPSLAPLFTASPSAE